MSRIGWLSIPIVGYVELYREGDVPQELWEKRQWMGYVAEKNATYYCVEGQTGFDRKWFGVEPT